jgi:hypothetical protein
LGQCGENGNKQTAEKLDQRGGNVSVDTQTIRSQIPEGFFIIG